VIMQHLRSQNRSPGAEYLTWKSGVVVHDNAKTIVLGTSNVEYLIGFTLFTTTTITIDLC